MYSLDFSRAVRLAQDMCPRQDVRSEKKVWVTKAPPQNCRHGVHLHFSGIHMSDRDLGRQTLLHAGSGDICHI